MFDYFFPDRYIASTYVIDFEKLYEKGVRGLIFDIDNTLVPHGAPADKRAVELFARLKKIGFRCCLISNNQEPRVKMFNEKIQVDYIYNAHKPSTKNYRRAMEIMGTKEESTVFIGDQLFTDVYGAKKDRHPQYSRKADPSKRRDSDRAQTLSGKNSTTFLQKGGGDFIEHVVIIGFMGSGKTRVGKQLSKIWGCSLST